MQTHMMVQFNESELELVLILTVKKSCWNRSNEGSLWHFNWKYVNHRVYLIWTTWEGIPYSIHINLTCVLWKKIGKERAI